MKKEVMKRAWEIYRTLSGDRNAKLSQALKQAWAEMKNDDEIVNGWNVTALENAGASRWTKYGKDRVYIRAIGDELMGLEKDYYKSGNISSASLKGEYISNGEAFRVMRTYADCYIDLESGIIYNVARNDYHDEFVEKLKNNIRV